MLGELYCDCEVLLWSAMGPLVGLLSFKVSWNFRLVEACAGVLGLMRFGVSRANLARSLYSLLTPDNRNFFLINTKFWFAYPEILMPSRMV